MISNIGRLIRSNNRKNLNNASLSIPFSQCKRVKGKLPFINQYTLFFGKNSVRYLNQVVQSSQVFEDDLSKMNYCNKTMESNNSNKLYESTLRIFNMMISENIKKDATSYTLVIEALVALRRLDEAEERLKDSIDNNIREVRLFLPLFKYYCNKYRPDDAIRLYKTLEDMNINPNDEVIYLFMILFKKVNRISKSIETFYNFKKYRNGNIGSILYNEILPILIRLKRYEEAKDIYNDMEKTVDILEKYYTHESSVAIVTIKALYEGLDNVIYWIEELPTHGIVVKNDHFFSAMNIFCERNMMNEFYLLLDKACSCIGKLGFSITARHLYDLCMLKFKELRNVKLAEDFIETIKMDKYYKDETLYYGFLSTIYLRIGDEKKARSILDPFLPKNAHKLNRGILREFFNYYASMGDYNEAMEIVRKFKFALIEKDYIYFDYAKACFDGNVELAKQLFFKLTENRIRQVSININEILNCFIRAKRFNDAEIFFEKINSKFLEYNMTIYENLLRIYAETRRYNEFMDYLEEIKDDIQFEYTEKVHNAIMVAMLRDDKALELKDYFKSNYIGLIIPNSDTIAILVSAYYKDFEFKDFLVDLWESTVMNYKIKLDIETLIKYLEFCSVFGYKEIGLCILKKLVSITGRDGYIIERNQCYEIRNSMIRLRFLHQASPTWNDLLEFSNQTSVVMSSYETQNFSKLIDLSLK